MLTKLSKKILPVMLAFVLAAPSVFGHSIPAIAAEGNDGAAVVLTEDSLTQEETEGFQGGEGDSVSQEENTGSEEEKIDTEETLEDEENDGVVNGDGEEDETALNHMLAGEGENGVTREAGGLEEGIYTIPLTAYGIGKPMDGTAYPSIGGWYALTGTVIGSQGLPAFNERAKVEVVSGGAITLTLRVDSVLEHDAFQIMRLEKSAEYSFGEKVDLIYWLGNAAVAMVNMGTFNLPAGYLEADITNAALFDENNNQYYYQEDRFSVIKNPENGYTELSLIIDSIEELDRLVIKNALAIDANFPVGTSFLVFQKDNMVKIPSLEEFSQIFYTSVQLTDIVNTKTQSGTASKIQDVRKPYVENLFSEAAITVENEKITVSGNMTASSFEGIYAIRHVRQYTGGSYPEEGSTSSELLNYRNPYYKTQFATFYNKYTAQEGDYQFSFTFDYTMDNLVYGVPVSLTSLRLTSTDSGNNYEFSDYTEEDLEGKSAIFARFHLLPRTTEEIIRYSPDGNIRLVTDTATLPESVILDAWTTDSASQYETLYSLSKQKEDGSRYINAYTYNVTVNGSPIITSKDMELGIKVPEDWERNNNLYAMWFWENNGAYLYQYKDGTLQIDEEGYVTIKTNQPMGELYLYVQETPEDLTKLTEGIYSVDITAMHSTQQGRASMSNNALVKNASLVISRNPAGELVKELYMDFKIMYIGDIEGRLSNVAAADNYKGNNVTYGDILDYFTVGDSGELLTEPSYKEPYGLNVYLVKSAKVTLKEYTGSEELFQNYYPIYFEVPPMDSDPTDGIDLQVVRLMVSNVRNAEENSSLPVYQKTVLKKALNEGYEVEADMYTADSFRNLQDVLEAAEEIYDSNPSEVQILEQTAAIYTAISALEVDEDKKADKTVLGALLEQAKGYKAEDYTATSYENLQEAVALSEAIYEKESARQSEVDEQAEILRAAIEALVLVSLGSIAPDKLPDGTYTIPVRLWHAVKDSPSMGDAAVERTGILEIKDGKATLQMEMKALVFAGLTGYLMQFNILSDYIINAASGYPENYTKNPAAVLETHEYVDRYNAEDSADELCRGKKYPKTLQFDITLPSVTGVDYTWVHVYVPVMGELDNGDQEARLRLDYTAIAKVGEPAISLDYNTVTLNVGETKTLTASLTNTDAAVTWSSSNSSVAAVDNNGKVTALAVGSTTITAVAGSISAQCTVTVTTAGTGGNTGGGSANPDTGLRDGTYSIPVSLWHAGKDQASMGNAALVQSGRLVIDSGRGTLYITFQSMTYLGQNGYLSELLPSTVISTYRVVDQFNSETSTDDRVKGKKYPSVLAVPVIPGEEYTPVSVYVPVMGSLGVGEQDARLKLSYSSAVYMSGSTDLDSPASNEDLYFKEGEAIEGTGESKAETKILITENGKRYFYENNEKLTSQFITYYGYNYYVGEDGAVLTLQFVTHEDNLYYAGENGAMVTYQLVTAGNKTYYAGKGGVIATSAMISHKGKEYYAYKTGRIATSVIITYEGAKYYAGKDGAIVKGAMVIYKDKKYYAYMSGKIATSVMVTYEGKKYYAYSTGRIATSAMVTYNDKKYYAYSTGRIATSAMITHNGKQYYAYKTGRIATSAMITHNGKQYYAYKTGRIATSAMVTHNGKKYYAYQTGRIAASTMITHNGKQYYAYKTGRIATSTMVTHKGKQYYAYQTGRIAASAMVTYKGTTYYAGKDGAIVL